MQLTISARELLRHSLATAAYRAAKTLCDAPESFADFRVADTARTPVEIVAHMGDLLNWALSISQGKQVWKDSAPLPWPQEVDRFFDSLKRFDEYLRSGEQLHASVEKLFQGPAADVLNHVGQLAMLRRLAGIPIRPENFYQAEISAGRVGKDQPPPRREF